MVRSDTGLLYMCWPNKTPKVVPQLILRAQLAWRQAELLNEGG